MKDESGNYDDKRIQNVIVFLGADHKVGTSMICRMIGESLSKNKDTKILMLCFDGTVGMDYTHANSAIKGMDDYKAKMTNNILSSKDFMNICREDESLYFMKGCESMIKSKYYFPNDIYNFLNILSTLFDILLVDVGSSIELGMAIGGLKAGGKVVLVTDQKEKSFKRYGAMKNEILCKLNIPIDHMIVNKIFRSREFQDPEILAVNYQCDLLGQIEYSEQGLYAELEKSSLLNFKDSQINESIEGIRKKIEDYLGIERQTDKTNKKINIKKYFLKKGWI
jgi:MinD-like ATPase involved in chromosome partitioning or flagellar assembly